MANEDDVETLDYDNLSAVAHLQSSERYNSIMQVLHSLRIVLLCFPALAPSSARAARDILGSMRLPASRCGCQC
jgi:hypothetical protein